MLASSYFFFLATFLVAFFTAFFAGAFFAQAINFHLLWFGPRKPLPKAGLI